MTATPQVGAKPIVHYSLFIKTTFRYEKDPLHSRTAAGPAAARLGILLRHQGRRRATEHRTRRRRHGRPAQSPGSHQRDRRLFQGAEVRRARPVCHSCRPGQGQCPRAPAAGRREALLRPRLLRQGRHLRHRLRGRRAGLPCIRGAGHGPEVRLPGQATGLRIRRNLRRPLLALTARTRCRGLRIHDP